MASPVLTAAAPRQAAPQPQAPQTALDRYVAAPDANFSWKVLKPLPAEGATATLLEMTSQKWLTEQEVERPLWTHWLTVVRPPEVKSDVALLYITGGSLERQPPSAPPAWLVNAAKDTGTVTVELRLVPNQPVVFKDDPTRKPRTEDDFIAYTWDKYLRTGDEKWPARLPMTKSAVRAMDAVTQFAAGRRRRREQGRPLRRLGGVEARLDDLDHRGGRSTGDRDRAGGDRHAEPRAVVHPSLSRLRRLVGRGQGLHRSRASWTGWARRSSAR